jgi:hypothetical protein
LEKLSDRASLSGDTEAIQILDKGRRPLCYGNCAPETVAEAKAEAEAEAQAEAKDSKTREDKKAAAIRELPSSIMITRYARENVNERYTQVAA